ncbi:hypothetical protein ASF61_07185 [Duganella sp. Leaf126]|uniref:hypothetical protein n=1 Tax=Duganella sp. Leaf126 TaxID=1736266 RepID=UPI0006F675B2|nr:hypothetical protein [Duganella sp. Leaf126]KQQ35993.1 hypothetical protein ASF61_07185 [Duganella sp. Leaf126]
MSAYLPLLHLSARLAFFGEQAMHRFRFAPCAATAARLARLGIVCQAHTGGLTLAAPASLHRALRSGDAAVAAALDLAFLAWSTGVSFPLVTALAPPAAHARLLFQGAGAVHESGSNWRLHAGTEADASAWQLATEPHRIAAHDDCTLAAPHPAFQVVLDGAAITAALAQTASPRFLVRFGARRTRWKYYLPGDLLARLPAGSVPAIVDPDGVLSFIDGRPSALPDGRPALTFISEQAVAMRQHPPQRLQLHARGASADGAADRLLIDRLPNASVAGVVPDMAAGSDAVLVSEIYLG